jgi:2-amino-4-hydroxy-6-hydroxymethyldihydropteridine diphosphokinase
VIKQDILENRVKIAYLGIGSNLGSKQYNIETAKFKLQTYNIEIIKCSSNYETLSWPNPKNPTFINIVIKVQTFLSFFKLYQICNLIENDLGRKRLKRNDPRTCDIDIIDFDQQIIKYKNGQNLISPHPRMDKRNFVLLPLFEISKSWIHPQKKVNIKKLINLLSINNLKGIKQI